MTSIGHSTSRAHRHVTLRLGRQYILRRCGPQHHESRFRAHRLRRWCVWMLAPDLPRYGGEIELLDARMPIPGAALVLLNITSVCDAHEALRPPYAPLELALLHFCRLDNTDTVFAMASLRHYELDGAWRLHTGLPPPLARALRRRPYSCHLQNATGAALPLLGRMPADLTPHTTLTASRAALPRPQSTLHPCVRRSSQQRQGRMRRSAPRRRPERRAACRRGLAGRGLEGHPGTLCSCSHSP